MGSGKNKGKFYFKQVEIPMRQGIILLGDMKQEAIRQLLHWDGREIGSGKKKGECFSPHQILAPPMSYITLYNSPVALKISTVCSCLCTSSFHYHGSSLVFSVFFFLVSTSDGSISAAV